MDAIYGRRQTSKRVDSLKSLKIGVISGYSYGPRIDSYIRNNRENRNRVWFLVGEDALVKGLRMLKFGRIDALIEDGLVVEYTLNRMGLSEAFVTAGKTMAPEKLWIGFSPAKPESEKLAQILSQGMIKIRQDSRLTRILNRYGLSDWKQTP